MRLGFTIHIHNWIQNHTDQIKQSPSSLCSFLSAVVLLSLQSQDKINADAITGSLLQGLDKQQSAEHGVVSTTLKNDDRLMGMNWILMKTGI